MGRWMSRDGGAFASYHVLLQVQVDHQDCGADGTVSPVQPS